MRVLLCAIALAALPAASPATAQAPAGDGTRGAQLFANQGCYECHGRAAQGSILTGPRLARTELPFEAFAMQIRTPGGEMPPYRGASEQDLRDMYAFLRKLPPPPSLASIPLLNR